MLLRYLSPCRLVTITQIEGRVRAAGSEFVLACDMRFAARESAIFAQFEPAFGQIPGGPAAAHAVVKQRVNAIALAPAEELRRDSGFAEMVRAPDAQRGIDAAMKNGLQTREGALTLVDVLRGQPDG